jgi:diacylglycerol kinase (ATP)
VIANPAAGRRKANRDFSAIRSAFPSVDACNFSATKFAGDEEKLAKAAIASGAETVIAVGGDGTCSRVADAILKSGKPCRLGVVPTGTGNDFAKVLGVSTLPVLAIAQLVKRGVSTAIDVGRVDGHYFLNSTGFGFDESVLEATKRVRFLKGDAVYIYSALAQLFTYRGISVGVDSETRADALRMLMVTVSNGRFLGGAFRIAPHASVLDGQLDFGFFGDCNLIDRVRIFAEALRGTHLGHPSVRTERARAMSLSFSAPPMMEVDGELRQARSSTVQIECLPRALSVIAAPGFPF